MMKIRYCILSIILAFVLQSARAQFEIPRLSQYLINGMVINPAYAGTREAMSITAVHKRYLTGFEGNPTSYKLAAHTPFKKNEQIAGGFSLESNNYSYYSNLGLYGHYAYRIWLGGLRLSMGLKAGIYHYKEDYTDLDLYHSESPDPAFVNRSGVAPNFGAGVYLYNQKFFTGFSVPYLLDFPKADGGINFSPGSLHYMLTAGYLLDLSPNMKIKPSALFDYNKTKSDLQAGLNLIMLDDRFWLGAIYRTGSKGLSGIFEVQLSSTTRIGYVYDHFFTNLSKISNGTHEFMLRYEFNYKVDVEVPIYF